VQSFSPDVARAIDGPGWLSDARAEAAERAQAASLPTPDEEIWRYSRIRELDLHRFLPARGVASLQGGTGVLADFEPDDLAWIGADGAAPDVFAELNTAFVDPVVLRVPAGKVVTEPVVLDHRTVAGRATFPRLVVEAGPDSEITVIERYRSADGDPSLVVPVVSIRAHQAARVRYLALNELSSTAWMIGHQLACGDRDSSITLGTVALGGDYARVRTEARALGQGASTTQVALYFADGHQMHDFRTIQDHVAPKTQSDLLFKGAVADHAKSVYTGLIRIGHEAKGAAAFQTNRNLTLSEGAWAESVPNLDIKTNDVRCSHASTVGPIDVDQRFYLESRGIRPEAAERLVVLGFFDEVLERLPVATLRSSLREQVSRKFTSARLEEVTA
jgi:Fe-S cluster assembly protein SufD